MRSNRFKNSSSTATVSIDSPFRIAGSSDWRTARTYDTQITSFNNHQNNLLVGVTGRHLLVTFRSQTIQSIRGLQSRRNPRVDQSWQWISTKANIADDGTKWAKTPDLSTNSRWLKGPSFLWQRESDWPASPTRPDDTAEELRRNLLFHVTTKPIIQIDRFSKWNRLLRSVAVPCHN